MGKLAINGSFLIAMLNYQRVVDQLTTFFFWGMDWRRHHQTNWLITYMGPAVVSRSSALTSGGRRSQPSLSIPCQGTARIPSPELEIASLRFVGSSHFYAWVDYNYSRLDWIDRCTHTHIHTVHIYCVYTSYRDSWLPPLRLMGCSSM